MLETSKWGSVDVAFNHRRKTLGITNYTCHEPLTIVAHQNHDLPTDIKTPRVEEGWKQELKDVDLNDPVKLVYPHVNNLGWD